MIRQLANLLRHGAPQGPLPSFRTPAGTRIYAVGDIHGRMDLLERMLGQLQADASDFSGPIHLVFLGDYIDRGPHSAQVVTFLQNNLPPKWQTTFLRGNHEQAMLDFLADPAGRPNWLAWGGTEALSSYGIKPFGATGTRNPAALAAELELALDETGHRSFYTSTRLFYRLQDYLFVHAGVRPGIAPENQLQADLLYIREDFLGRPHHLPYRVVFGHTIFPEPLVQPERLGLDTGAFHTGILTAAALEDTSTRLLQVQN